MENAFFPAPRPGAPRAACGCFPLHVRAFYTRSPASRDALPASPPLSVVPIEAVADGDLQVLAARVEGKERTPLIDLDVLAGFPAVESLVASTRLRASRQLPSIRELLLSSAAPLPEASTLRHLTGLEALYAQPTHGNVHLDLDALPA